MRIDAAFPVVLPFDTSSKEEIGLNKLEYFATRAPEDIPTLVFFHPENSKANPASKLG